MVHVFVSLSFLQACSPVQVSVVSRGPGCQAWTPSPSVSGHNNTPVGPKTDCVSLFTLPDSLSVISHILA